LSWHLSTDKRKSCSLAVDVFAIDAPDWLLLVRPPVEVMFIPGVAALECKF